MPNLTDLKIKKLQPKEKIYRLSDGNNLYIEVKPNGLKFWRFRYKIKGKSTMLSLGKYPEISVKKARQLAYENNMRTLAHNAWDLVVDDVTTIEEIIRVIGE